MSPCMTCWVQIITNVSILSKIRKKKNNDKLTRRLDSAKSVGMITWYERDSNEKSNSLNGLYTLKGDEKINYSTTNLAARN